ncbi:uncharacterized protein LOC129749733 [Uranotaenia lowii]|uniref:uncharacterized protein LOC129749733 n=1 Tax=Uranotaenia lowii TaxID=190385 RepID=UPI00247A08CC|nr:uncharacterized protein LOC129749733 [Uranotaenia lowii]
MESPPANTIPSAPTPLLLCYFFHICGSSAQGPPPDPSDPFGAFDDFADSWQKRLNPLLNFESKIYGIQNDFDKAIKKLKDENADPAYQAALQDISVMLRQLTDAMKADYSEALSYIIKDVKAFFKILFEPYVTAKSNFMEQATTMVRGTAAQKACADNAFLNHLNQELGLFAGASGSFATTVMSSHVFYYHYFTRVLEVLKASCFSLLGNFKNPLYSSDEIKSFFQMIYPSYVLLSYNSIGSSSTELFYISEGSKALFYFLNGALFSSLIEQQKMLDSC